MADFSAPPEPKANRNYRPLFAWIGIAWLVITFFGYEWLARDDAMFKMTRGEWYVDYGPSIVGGLILAAGARTPGLALLWFCVGFVSTFPVCFFAAVIFFCRYQNLCL